MKTRRRLKLNHALLMLACLTLAACADTKQPSFASPMSMNSAAPLGNAQGQQPATIRGSIVDGPVDNRVITITTRRGEVKKSITENGAGSFALATIFAKDDFPLIYRARDEAQLLVIGDPGFTLLSTSPRPALGQRVSINAYSTLITKTAMKLPGGIDPTTIEKATTSVTSQLNFGLYGEFKDNPTSTLTTEANIHIITKANEALSEMIRRTSRQLNMSGRHMTPDDVIDALAADLVDGQLNGVGAVGTHPRISAVANFIAGQVALEAITNELRVRNIDATPSLDYIIASAYPRSQNRTRNVHLTDALIHQAMVAIEIANRISPNPQLSKTAAALQQLTSFMRPDRAKKILPGNVREKLGEISRRIVMSDSTTVKRLNAFISS